MLQLYPYVTLYRIPMKGRDMLIRYILLSTLLLTTTAFATEYLRDNVTEIIYDDNRVVDTIKGEVDEIVNGDTIVIDTDRGDIVVRLYGIDAPEKTQEYGRESRNLLKDLIDDEDVKVEVITIVDKKAVIGKVYYDGEYINATMLREGAAWYDHEFANDRVLEKAEAMAQERGRGLWQAQDPTPPWIFVEEHSDNTEYYVDDDNGISLIFDFFEGYNRSHRHHNDYYYRHRRPRYNPQHHHHNDHHHHRDDYHHHRDDYHHHHD